ncbi:caspase family protein [Clostridium sp. 'deep sea']|uniref:caspase family protein n=1 Tax=Clostridium sp. 'deep sea' TaxID=2779445 RepID=UPI0018963FA3|nr:caspase family protein [Clostridium sp. 'deep sea']QOR35069.1 caspase family protein [Clostridium sp. 'deep sea']
MKKALIIGIDYYSQVSKLYGCVNDAYAVKSVLERHSDGTRNFGVKLEVSFNEDNLITKSSLKDLVNELFRDSNEIALFYYSGHGYIESIGGYLVTSECLRGDEGLSLNELLQIVNDSPARNKIIVLDTCHSGIAGTPNIKEGSAVLKEGVTILTASAENQYAIEENGEGVFTRLFVDALNGSAANLVGDVTPGSVYAHIDQSLGEWQQRPIFKTNVRSFVSLRKVQAPIDISDLRKITDYFPEKGCLYDLDPSYEPDSENPDEDKNEIFSILQKFNRVNLLVPVGTEHMYYAAMENKACKLTVLGEHYWELAKSNLI